MHSKTQVISSKTIILKKKLNSRVVLEINCEIKSNFNDPIVAQLAASFKVGE